MPIKSLPRHAATLALPFLTLPVALVAMAQDAAQSDDEIAEIIVTADFRPSELQSLPASLTVMSTDAIQARAAQHLEEIINLAPNVNFSGGSSRARYL